MQKQLTIQWNQAQEISKQVIQNRTQAQEEALREFKEASHEMTDARDLIYYLEATGTEEKNIFDLLQYAKNLSPLIWQPLHAGAALEDLLNVDPYIEPEEEEPEPADIELLNGDIKVYFIKNFNDEYIIHVGNFDGYGYSYPDDETTYKNLNQCKEVNHSEFINFAKQNNI